MPVKHGHEMMPLGIGNEIGWADQIAIRRLHLGEYFKELGPCAGFPHGQDGLQEKLEAVFLHRGNKARGVLIFFLFGEEIEIHFTKHLDAALAVLLGTVAGGIGLRQDVRKMFAALIDLGHPDTGTDFDGFRPGLELQVTYRFKNLLGNE